MLSFLLSYTALFIDPAFCAVIERRDTYTCPNRQYGPVRISRNKAELATHDAPLNDGGTQSGYPHRFYNTKNIKWPNKHCNNLKKGYILLEVPVLPNSMGKKLYDLHEKPKQRPYTARAIFTSPSKDFCGVIAHTDGEAGPLELCH